MRVIVFVKATEDSEAGIMPSTELLEAMGRYNEELVDAGIMVGGDGLKPSVAAKRVAFDGASRMVIDGPFAETKELIAGYTIIQTRSREEALEWSRRFPNPSVDGGIAEIEVRQMYELEDFGASEATERFRELGVAGSR